MTNVNEQIEYADINDSALVTDEEKTKIKESKVRYPIWKPNIIGQSLKAYVHEILDFSELNDGKGSILLNLKTSSESFPFVAFWLNTVAISQIMKLSGKKPDSESFADKVKVIQLMQDKLLLIQFEGEVASKIKGRKAYQNYTIVEI
jgi:hypothetical protein